MNGAGKTSLINVITGSYRANEGSVHLGDRDILALPLHRRAALGLTRTFQNLALFGGMSVFDNVTVGRHLHIREGILNSLLPIPGFAVSSDERDSEHIVTGLLEKLGLSPVLATALVAAVADPKSFRSGRNFSAWIGIVPKQHSSGGKKPDINSGSFRAPRCTSVNPASVSGSPTEEVEEAAAFLACEAQGLGEPVMTPYEPPES